MTVKLPYIKWRDGRPRAVHGPRQRALGFVDADLRHPPFDAKGRPVGPWFTYEEASAFSKVRHADIVAGKRVKKAAPARRRITVSDLLADWKASDEWCTGLSPTSQASYEKGIAAITFRPMTRTAAAEHRARAKAARLLGLPEPARELEPIASATPSSLGKPELRAFFNYARTARGHHMALAMIATLSAAMTWGQESMHWRLGANPRQGMEFERPEGRVVLVTIPEFLAWVAAADALGRPSIGDSFYLALFTGQRQTDRLAMRDESEIDGRHAFRQSKTGELVDIKEAPQLTARLDAARARVAAITLRLGLRERPKEIVINEENGRPYDESTYRHWVSTARELAIKGSNALGLAPCPTLAFINARGEPDQKHDQDLRDTCVMMLDRAGCDLLTICDITGHSYKSAQTIVKHYRARNPDRADQGIDRLVLQVRKEGMAG